jgi:hypothetical protein
MQRNPYIEVCDATNVVESYPCLSNAILKQLHGVILLTFRNFENFASDKGEKRV